MCVQVRVFHFLKCPSSACEVFFLQINYESKEPPVLLCVQSPQRTGREPEVLYTVI
jgi:hypothetical protein